MERDLKLLTHLLADVAAIDRIDVEQIRVLYLALR